MSDKLEKVRNSSIGFPGNVRLRQYKGGDEKAIVELWNKALPKDAISPLFFRNRVLLDPNFDPAGCFLAEDSAGTLVGFLLALYRKTPLSGTDLEPDNGWITAFYVDPAHRGKGIGRLMFDAAESYLGASGRTNIYISSYAPNYVYPGVDEELYSDAVEFLTHRDYSTLYPAVAMDKNLVGFDVPGDVAALKSKREEEGFFFGNLSTPFLSRTLSFAQDEFGSDWARAIREGLVRGIPYDNFLIAEKEGRIVGFALFGAYDNVAERFGPFGVDASLRGLGLGKILLYYTLDAMRQNGLHNAWFLWTGEKSPAGMLYKRAGFEVTRRFLVMKKSL